MSRKRVAARSRPLLLMPKIASDISGRPPKGSGESTSPPVARTLFAAAAGSASSEEEPSEEVSDPEEEEDHDRHHGGDQSHHREKLRAGPAIHARILAQNQARIRHRGHARRGLGPVRSGDSSSGRGDAVVGAG